MSQPTLAGEELSDSVPDTRVTPSSSKGDRVASAEHSGTLNVRSATSTSVPMPHGDEDEEPSMSSEVSDSIDDIEEDSVSISDTSSEDDGIESSIASKKDALLETLAAIEAAQRARVVVEGNLERAQAALAKLELDKDAKERENERLLARQMELNRQIAARREGLALTESGDTLRVLEAAEERSRLLRGEGEEIEKENERMRLEARVAEVHLGELKGQVERWQGELVRLRAAQKEVAGEGVVNEIKAENAKLKAEMETMMAREEQKGAELVMKDRELAESEGKLSKLEEEIETLKRELEGQQFKVAGEAEEEEEGEQGMEGNDLVIEEELTRRLEDTSSLLRAVEADRDEAKDQWARTERAMMEEITLLKAELQSKEEQLALASDNTAGIANASALGTSNGGCSGDVEALQGSMGYGGEIREGDGGNGGGGDGSSTTVRLGLELHVAGLTNRAGQEEVESIRSASSAGPDCRPSNLQAAAAVPSSSRSVGVNTPMKLGIDTYAGTDVVKVGQAAVNTDRNDMCDDGSGLTWAEKDRLAREVAELKSKAIEFSNKASRVTGIEEELKVLERKKGDAVDTLALIKRQMDEATVSKGNALASAKAEKEQLLKELEDMRHEKRQVEKDVHDLRKNKESLCEEEEAARAEFRDAERKRTDAMEKLEAVQGDLKRFTNTKQELMEARRTRDTLVEERERIAGEMKEEIKDLEKRDHELRRFVKELKAEHDRLKRSVEDLVHRRESEDAVLHKIVAAEKDTEAEEDRLQHRIRFLVEDVGSLTSRRNKTDTDLKDAYSLLERVQLQIADVEARRDAMNDELRNAEQRLKECEKERTDLLTEIAQLHHFRDKLEVRCDVFAKDFDRANDILGELHYEISLMERRRDAMRSINASGSTRRESSGGHFREHPPGQPYQNRSPQGRPAAAFRPRRRKHHPL